MASSRSGSFEEAAPGDIVTWRIVPARHTSGAFSGDGARRFPGRWNTSGVRMIYTSGSQALALLEILVNLDTPALLDHYVVIPVRFDRRLCLKLSPHELPADWATPLPSENTRRLGAKWCAGGRSLALEVPSAVVPLESNYLLNPAHPDFKSVRIGEAVAIDIDGRLVARKKSR